VRQVGIVARDRGGGYALAVAKPLLHTITDCRSLASHGKRQPCFFDTVRKSMPEIRGAVGAGTITPSC
jgi:hypothetical protein